jgi:hypothetical protein
MGGGKPERACHMLPTKTDTASADHAQLEQLVTRAFRIRAEQQSGYPRQTDRMASIEFRVFLMIAELEEEQELMLRQDLKHYLALGFGIQAKG